MNGLTKIKDKEFNSIKELVYNKFGIKLDETKKSLVVSRLQSELRKNSFKDFSEYYQFVIRDVSGTALSNLIDKISTNHTFFNREHDHFEYLLESVLPETQKTKKRPGGKKYYIWCAGCSSGEEAYMLAILLTEYFGENNRDWDLGVLATDISDSALDKAKLGIYSNRNIDSIPANLRIKYFNKINGDNWKISEKLKKIVLYCRLNLMRESFPFKSKFDVIFCRNVMIYFDQVTRNNLIAKFHRHTRPEGFLFIGHSETIGRDNKLFNYVRPSVYRMPHDK